jgi:hypothetical protein
MANLDNTNTRDELVPSTGVVALTGLILGTVLLGLLVVLTALR